MPARSATISRAVIPLVTGNDTPSSYQTSSVVNFGSIRAMRRIAASTCSCCSGVHLVVALAWLAATANLNAYLSCLVSTVDHVF